MPSLSLIDFAFLYDGETPADGFHRSITLAQQAEKYGFERIWYTEHHNMPRVAASSPAIMIGYVAPHTKHIRLGSGGVMLPNHAPLVVAEQFGALAHMYPGRIDLGLGRAPGTDRKTLYALRRSETSAQNFGADVMELQGFLGDHSRISSVNAYPGKGTKVPLYILGSSLYGARLAAELGLPYSFASHFAPQHMYGAIATYTDEFHPSQQQATPYVIAAVNVCVGDTQEEAEAEFQRVKRARVRSHLRQEISDADLDVVMETDGARSIVHQLSLTAVGTGDDVCQYLEDFAEKTGAHELMLCIQSTSHASAIKALDAIGPAWQARKKA